MRIPALAQKFSYGDGRMKEMEAENNLACVLWYVMSASQSEVIERYYAGGIADISIHTAPQI